eukprot:m.84135 g.84135  ORF g.84135 m.84135 type:complete len:317 (-) comp19690_c0_seq2:9-959(-)
MHRVPRASIWYGSTVTVPFVEARRPNGTLLGRVRYIKMYSDDARTYDLIERACDVVALQYSFHWKLEWSGWQGRVKESYYPPAVESAMAFLSNFSASTGKMAIWRGTGATHFPDGTYVAARDSGAKATCAPFTKECAADEQHRNTVVRAIASRMARNGPPLPHAVLDPATVHLKFPSVANETLQAWTHLLASPCDRKDTSEKSRRPPLPPAYYDLTVNQSAPYGQSRFTFWQEQNYTAAVVRERDRVTTGRVYWWPIFDLFAPHWYFHANDKDCLHYCYFLGPFDAAFERLTLLITNADKEGRLSESTALPSWECT